MISASAGNYCRSNPVQVQSLEYKSTNELRVWIAPLHHSVWQYQAWSQKFQGFFIYFSMDGVPEELTAYDSFALFNKPCLITLRHPLHLSHDAADRSKYPREYSNLHLLLGSITRRNCATHIMEGGILYMRPLRLWILDLQLLESAMPPRTSQL